MKSAQRSARWVHLLKAAGVFVASASLAVVTLTASHSPPSPAQTSDNRNGRFNVPVPCAQLPGVACLPEELYGKCDNSSTDQHEVGAVFIGRCSAGFKECWVQGHPYCAGRSPAEQIADEIEAASNRAREAAHNSEIEREAARLGAHRRAEIEKSIKLREAAEAARLKGNPPKSFNCFTGQWDTIENVSAYFASMRSNNSGVMVCPK